MYVFERRERWIDHWRITVSARIVFPVASSSRAAVTHRKETDLMKSSLASSAVVAWLALAGCGSDGSGEKPSAGGSTSAGGQPGSAGGSGASGGASGSGGSGAIGGAVAAGGNNASGGTAATGG